MNITKHTAFASLAMLCVTGALPLGASADRNPESVPLVLAAAQVHRGEGTVKEVRANENRIKIDHGPIKSLGWSGMTMFFDVKGPEVLEGIKVGDKVAFDLEKGKNGRYVIIRMTPAK